MSAKNNSMFLAYGRIIIQKATTLEKRSTELKGKTEERNLKVRVNATNPPTRTRTS
jgi:hypothetical protein